MTDFDADAKAFAAVDLGIEEAFKAKDTCRGYVIRAVAEALRSAYAEGERVGREIKIVTRERPPFVYGDGIEDLEIKPGGFLEIKPGGFEVVHLSPWLPMETAPRPVVERWADAPLIMAWHPALDAPRLVRWHHWDELWLFDGGGGGAARDKDLSGWMSIPPPPAAIRSQGQDKGGE